MNWLKEIPFFVLIPIALLMAALPIEPEPHLIEKLRMLSAGNLRSFIDIFDLFWHSLPTLLVLLKLYLKLKTP